MREKKGMTAVGFVVVTIIFAAIYFVGFAGQISVFLNQLLTTSGTTGIWAFVVGNFNLWIILGIIVALFFGGKAALG